MLLLCHCKHPQVPKVSSTDSGIMVGNPEGCAGYNPETESRADGVQDPTTKRSEGMDVSLEKGVLGVWKLVQSAYLGTVTAIILEMYFQPQLRMFLLVLYIRNLIRIPIVSRFKCCVQFKIFFWESLTHLI